MIETLLHSLNAVGVILILTACGYVCAALGWITPEVKSFLSKYLMRFAVPVMCIYSLRSNLTLELLMSFWRMLLIPLICSAALYALAGLVGRAFRLEPKQNSVYKLMCSVSNAMFIGYAMCTELFGDACVPYVMIFYLANTCFTQTLAMWLIRRSGEQEGGGWREALRFLRSPTVLGVLIGFALVLPLFFGLDGVLYSMPVSDLLTFLIAAVVIRKVYRELGGNQPEASVQPAMAK